MENSINPIVILILTQAMIFLGEIPNPISGEKNTDLPSSLRYIHMLSALYEKTRGNLVENEEKLLKESLDNLNLVYRNKVESKKG